MESRAECAIAVDDGVLRGSIDLFDKEMENTSVNKATYDQNTDGVVPRV
ncbi:MAG: hypothetical protein GY922_04805 [Proteobacteria bacterium]|nr:hypothetical protein [Pseudomonadota bacterium]